MAMHTHLVIFVTAEPGEIANGSAFERCAEFSRYECHITLRCTDGREITVTCSPAGPTCWGWRFFRAEWQKRHGVT